MVNNSDLFLKQRPTDILIFLLNKKKKVYPSQISKEINGTYPYIVKITYILFEMKLINFNKKGRIKYTELTPKGKKIAEYLNLIKYNLNH